MRVLRFDFTGLGSSEGEFANTELQLERGRPRRRRRPPPRPTTARSDAARRPQPRAAQRCWRPRRRSPRSRRSPPSPRRSIPATSPTSSRTSRSTRSRTTARRTVSLAGRPVHHPQAVPRRRERPERLTDAIRLVGAGPAGHALTRRQPRRHRQRPQDLRGGAAPEELRHPRRRRPPRHRPHRRRLRRVGSWGPGRRATSPQPEKPRIRRPRDTSSWEEAGPGASPVRPCGQPHLRRRRARGHRRRHRTEPLRPGPRRGSAPARR